MKYDFAYYQKSADYVIERIGFRPEAGIILGTSLGPIAEQIEDAVEISYADIPNFLVSTAPDHAGKLICGTLGGKKVACMSGRFHYYEGYDFEQIAAPIRLFKLIGCKAAIVTCAAGGVNLDYNAGDIMVISDHIKLMGASTVRGANIDEFGPRFFDMGNAYDASLRRLALELGKDSGITFREGVYFYMPGPQFETPAEIRAVRILGGDAVGMSTVTEAITAAHCSLPCLAFAVITNMAAGVLDAPMSTDDIAATGNMISGKFTAYMKKLIGRMSL